MGAHKIRNIVAVFNSLSEQNGGLIGSMVGLRLNSKVSIIAERKGPDIPLYSVAAVVFVGIAVLIGVFLFCIKRVEKREREEKVLVFRF